MRHLTGDRPDIRRLTPKRRFYTLYRAWRGETWFASSASQKHMHWAYQAIIGMGPPAVPLMLRHMEHDPDWFFWALASITGEWEVGADTDTLGAATEAWLAWGRERGILDQERGAVTDKSVVSERAPEEWVMWGSGKWHRMTGEGSQIVTACGAWTWAGSGHTVVEGMPGGSAAERVCRKCARETRSLLDMEDPLP